MDRLETLLTREEPTEGAVTPWTLERYVGGGLSHDEAGLVREALRADSALAAREAELRRQDDAFLASHPWGAARDELFRRAAELPGLADDPVMEGLPGGAPSQRGRSLELVWRSLAGVLAALALMWVALPPGEDPGIRTKGSPLSAAVLVDGAAQPLAAGAVVGEGTRLQLRLTSQRAFVAVLGVDGTGAVSRYLPASGSRSVPFEGGAHPLPGSLVLDAAPGPEVFVAFLSDVPLELDSLAASLRSLGDARGALGRRPPGLADGVDVATFHVEKEAPAGP